MRPTIGWIKKYCQIKRMHHAFPASDWIIIWHALVSWTVIEQEQVTHLSPHDLLKSFAMIQPSLCFVFVSNFQVSTSFNFMSLLLGDYLFSPLQEDMKLILILKQNPVCKNLWPKATNWSHHQKVSLSGANPVQNGCKADMRCVSLEASCQVRWFQLATLDLCQMQFFLEEQSTWIGMTLHFHHKHPSRCALSNVFMLECKVLLDWHQHWLHSEAERMISYLITVSHQLKRMLRMPHW